MLLGWFDDFDEIGYTLLKDCHRLDKLNPKSTIIRFVNRKKCYTGLIKKLGLWHIDKLKLGIPEAGLFFCESSTPYDQKLACKCTEMKRARKYIAFGAQKELVNCDVLWMNGQFLLRMKLNYWIFILTQSFEKGRNRLYVDSLF